MKDFIEKKLGELLSGKRPAILFDAMRYAVMTGGKRIRPQICLASAMAVGGTLEDAVYPACAIELLHCYTLVHYGAASLLFGSNMVRRTQFLREMRFSPSHIEHWR